SVLAGVAGAARVLAITAPLDHLLPERSTARHVVAPERAELVERHHHGVGKTAQAFHIEYDNLLQRRAAHAAGEHLVELFFVFDEDHPGAGIIDEIFDLPRRIRRIDPRGDAARA